MRIIIKRKSLRMARCPYRALHLCHQDASKKEVDRGTQPPSLCLQTNIYEKFTTCTDENPFSFNKEQIPKEVAFGEGTFLVASREIEQIYSNLSNLFPICLICTDLYDLTSSTVGSAR